MTHRRRYTTMDQGGTTEEYNARLEKWNNPNYNTRYAKARYEVTCHDDLFIRSVYAERDRLNDLEPKSTDPWEVDHIRPLVQGGLHVYENLRLLRASKNCDDQGRDEFRIDIILRIVAFNRTKGFIS